jgi:hypothetical protein
MFTSRFPILGKSKFWCKVNNLAHCGPLGTSTSVSIFVMIRKSQRCFHIRGNPYNTSLQLWKHLYPFLFTVNRVVFITQCNCCQPCFINSACVFLFLIQNLKLPTFIICDSFRTKYLVSLILVIFWMCFSVLEMYLYTYVVMFIIHK